MDDQKDDQHRGCTERNVEQVPLAIKAANPTVNNTHGQQQSKEQQQNWPHRVEAVCAVLLVFITGLYAFYARQQARAACDTLGEIIKQLPELKKSADAAADNATAAKNQSVIAKQAYESSGRAATDAIKASRQLVEQTKRSIESTQTAAQKALDASISASRLEERAWVSLHTQDVKATGSASGNAFQLESFGLSLINTGKSPALNIVGHYMIRVRAGTDPIPDYDEEMGKLGRTTESSPSNFYTSKGDVSFDAIFVKNQVLGPSSTWKFDIGGFGMGDRTDKRRHLLFYVYVLGTINYDDAVGTGKRHRTRFCLVNEGGGEPDNLPMVFCKQGNWMD